MITRTHDLYAISNGVLTIRAIPLYQSKAGLFKSKYLVLIRKKFALKLPKIHQEFIVNPFFF